MMSAASWVSSSTVSWEVRGAPSGRPILHFHGWPSSRLEELAPESLLSRLNLRCYSLDRPGYGQSCFHPAHHTFSTWATRVALWADSQRLHRFHVSGFSGGGPFAQAVAAFLPERVLSLTLINPLAPFGPGLTEAQPPWAGPGEWLLRRPPSLALRTFAALNLLRKASPSLFERLQLAGFHPLDRRRLNQHHILKRFTASHHLAMRQGVQHLLADLHLYRNPWDFHPRTISCPTHIYVGLKDIQVPPACGKWLAQAIPGATLHTFPDEAHYLAHVHAGLILRNL